MSLHRGFSISLRLLVILLVALAIASVASAAKSTPAANQIYVHNQVTKNGVAVIDEVIAAEDGWIVVYKRADLATDMIVGYAPVAKGTNQGVRVTLDNARLKDISTLWVRLHVDQGKKGVFEWGRGKPLADFPAAENGQPVITTFGTTGSGADLALTPAISVKSQATNANSIVFDSVTTPVDGWVVIYKDATLRPSEIVGHVPVYHGVNRNVKAAIEAWRIGKNNTLWAALYEDKATQKLMEVGHMGLTRGDPLYMYNGQPVIVAFGSQAP